MGLINKLTNFIEKKISTARVDSVSAETSTKLAFKALAIQIAVSYIANAISKCEIKFYKNGKKDTQSYQYYLWNVKPNDNQSGSEFINKLVTKMLTNPDGALVIQNNGKIYVADSYQRQPYPFREDEYSAICIETLALNKTFKASEVLHFRLEDENISELINSVYMEYGKAISYALDSFLKVNSSKFKMKIKQDKIGDLTFNEYYNQFLKEQLKDFLEGNNGIYPENEGFDLQEFKTGNQTKNCDDLVKLRKDMFQMVGEAYKIPVSMMEGNINNVTEIIKQFITFGVEPWTKLIEDVINAGCWNYEEWKKGCKVKIDTSKIAYTTLLDGADNASKLIANTICCPDEVRELFGLDSIEEEFGKQFFITKNNSKAEDVMDGTAEGGKE